MQQARATSDRDEGSRSGARVGWKWAAGATAILSLGALGLFNRQRAKAAETGNPPVGEFLDVDGVRLHYLIRGEGSPIVLLHGNGTMIEDWIVSGVIDSLAARHSVIAFDRPGFGHSQRPRQTIWSPAAQAVLIARALQSLGVSRPLIVGHSFGTQVALALALDQPQAARADVIAAAPPAIPGVGDVMRYTLSPVLGAAMLPKINRKLFAPAPVPASWTEDFPLAMTLRPWQLQASAAEAALMIPSAASLSRRYPALRLPVTIVAGDGDAVVDTNDQSRRLHAMLPQSRLVVAKAAGHMVHHSARDEVVGAILAAAAKTGAAG
jgi:pimeloyl-ACP methyl ester carboxylesterase